MSDRPTQESSEATSPSPPASRATNSARPLQSVRVSTNPPDHDSIPTSSQSGDRITLTGLAPAPLSTPTASEPPSSSNAAPQERAMSPEPAPVTLPSDPPRARSERPPAAPPKAARSQAAPARRRPLVAVAACAALALGAIWLAWPRARTSPEASATSALSTKVVLAGEKLRASSPTPAAAAVAALTATPAANPASERVPPEPRVNKITIQAKPAGAKFLVAGKEVAETVLNLELPVGERRTFEVILEGYATRKLVVDGSKSEMVIVMMPEKRAAAGVTAAAKDPPAAAERTARGETVSAEAR